MFLSKISSLIGEPLGLLLVQKEMQILKRALEKIDQNGHWEYVIRLIKIRLS